MRADVIVILTPTVEDALRVNRGAEDVRIETFVAQFPVKTFDERVFHGLAWSNEVELHVMRVRPGIHGAADEFAAIVDGDRRWGPALRHDRRQGGSDLDPR